MEKKGNDGEFSRGEVSSETSETSETSAFIFLTYQQKNHDQGLMDHGAQLSVDTEVS
jgi:hypothetical protein